MSLEEGKKAAAIKASESVKDGMIVGLGTGSTVYYFIEELIHQTQRGLSIQVVSSSEKSTKQAKAGGLVFANINEIPFVDLTVDGADEVDPNHQMIKGGGGALLREKILAAMSRDTIYIVDSSKLVSELGACRLPIEIAPFGIAATLSSLRYLGFEGALRKASDGALFITDENHIIFDITNYAKAKKSPEQDHQRLIQIPGVMETGLFLNLAKKVIVGYQKGETQERLLHEF